MVLMLCGLVAAVLIVIVALNWARVWGWAVSFWNWLFKIPSMAATIIGLIVSLTVGALVYTYPPPATKAVDVSIVQRQRAEIQNLQKQLQQAHHKIAQLQREHR